MIAVLTHKQIHDPARGDFRVRVRPVKDRITKRQLFYRGKRVMRDAYGQQFIILDS